MSVSILQPSENQIDGEPEVPDETHVNLKEKTNLILKSRWRGILCLITPIILICVLLPLPPEKYQWCAYTLILMAVFWVTECIPLPITSFLPIIIFPFTGIMNTSQTCSCYINDTIVMYLGSLILAYAVEQSGLHQRLALSTIRTIGYSHYRLLFAMSFTTMFVSMFITNTAATTMMVPINFAILQVFEDENLLKIYDTDSSGNTVASDIATCYFCSASFSATVGGIGTLVGTATNLVLKGLFIRTYPEAPEYLTFPQFSAFAIPYMLVLQSCVYLSMLIMYFGFLRPNSNAAKQSMISIEGMDAAKAAVDEKWQKLGKITYWEIMVIILFSGAMIMFFCRSPQIFVGWGDIIADHFKVDKKFVLDSAAAMLIGFLMFLLPSTLQFFKNFTAKEGELLPDTPVPSVLSWALMKEVMPFSFMFLLGGGFALSEGAKKEHSDLNGKIGELLESLNSLPNYFIILLIIIFTVFITNFAANVAVCNVVSPIVMQLIFLLFFPFRYLLLTITTIPTTDFLKAKAKEIKTNPLWYNIAAGFSASFCFCLPVGTPGNLIVQGAASIPTGKMIKAGIFPTIASIFVTWVCVCFWAPVIWPDLHTLPNWISPKPNEI